MSLRRIFKLKNIVFTLIAISFLLCFKIIVDDYYNPSSQFDLQFVLNEASRFYNNHHWMFNNNVMQYSSYLIRTAENSSRYLIEGLVFVNDGNVDVKSLSASDFSCSIYSKSDLEAKHHKAVKLYRLTFAYVLKVVCVYEHSGDISNDIKAAIVLNSDYASESDVNLRRMSYFGRNTFPYEMMNHQRPDIVVEKNPRLPEVAVCLQYVSKTYNGIVNWVEMHADFKVDRIVMHDGSPRRDLRKLLSKFSPQLVEIRDYYVEFEELCSTRQIKFLKQKHPTLYPYYYRACKRFFKRKFPGSWRDEGNHNHLSANDCYASMSYRYEFVTLYDLDELVLPRSLSRQKLIKSPGDGFSCDTASKVCQTGVFKVPMYDYLQQLVKQSFGHDISKLRSIEFHHAAYFIPNRVEKKLMAEFARISEQIEPNSQFPIELSITTRYMLFFKTRFVFMISRDDIDYVRYLSKSYKEFTCHYEKHLTNNVGTLDRNFLRYLYFIPEYNQRYPKSIHYTKNVESVFTHNAINYTLDSFVLTAEKKEAHLNSHFRADISSFYRVNVRISIKQLCVDVEYAAYLLQKYSSYCKSNVL